MSEAKNQQPPKAKDFVQYLLQLAHKLHGELPWFSSVKNEIIDDHGATYFSNVTPEIIERAKDAKGQADGCPYALGFLDDPSVFAALVTWTFSYLLVLRDDGDGEVRKVANKKEVEINLRSFDNTGTMKPHQMKFEPVTQGQTQAKQRERVAIRREEAFQAKAADMREAVDLLNKAETDIGKKQAAQKIKQILRRPTKPKREKPKRAPRQMPHNPRWDWKDKQTA